MNYDIKLDALVSKSGLNSLIFLDLYALIQNPVYCVESLCQELCGFFQRIVVLWDLFCFKKIMIILTKTREF